MQKLKLAAAVAGVITLAGCSDYDGSEVTREPTGPTFGYQFTDKESGDPISGTVTYKDHDGNVEEVYEVKDGAPDGTITYYFKNGDVSQHVVMSAGRMSGERKIYCDSNHDQLQMESDHGADPIKNVSYDCKTGLITSERYTAQSGKTVGSNKEWKIVDGKQVLQQVNNYNNEGQQDGLVEWYFPDGQLRTQQTYKNGDQEGPFKKYEQIEDGSYRLAEEGFYKNYGNVDGKTYRLDAKYPEGTVAEQYIPLPDGGFATVRIGERESQTGFKLGDGSAEQMIWKQIVERRNAAPSADELENLKYLLTQSKADLNKSYGHPYYYGPRGYRIVTAAAEGYYDHLISLGLDPKGVDFDGSSRLMRCLEDRECSMTHMIRLANDYIASGLKTKTLGGTTATMLFCMNQHNFRSDPKRFDLLALLIKLDDINAQNFAGNTALHYCMANSDLTAAKMLVDAGANRDVKNLNGVSPLLWAFVTENGSRMNLKWQPTTVQAVGELAQGSKFSFNDKLPLFEKSLNQIFLENGDAASSKAASAFN